MENPLASRIHLVIPMSGVGARFQARGYETPKPLLEVEGRPVIAHILDRFPGVGRCTFILNRKHAEETPLPALLKALRPDANLVVIDAHKRGPVHAVQQAYPFVRDCEPVVVNYCDFDWTWDFNDFAAQMALQEADGCVVGYSGFHPHLCGPDLYATLRVDGNRVLEIREKHAFAADRFAEHTSSGTYYFGSGVILKHAFDLLVANDLQVRGEFYASTPFQALVEEGRRILWYEVDEFCQWGTPDDFEEYLKWSRVFAARGRSSQASKPPTSFPETTGVVLMAGEGQRFAREGFTTPKPFIPVAGVPMVSQVVATLPRFATLCLAVRTEHLGRFPEVFRQMEGWTDRIRTVKVDKPTRGQACTAGLALQAAPKDHAVFIASCDAGLVSDWAAFQRFADAKSPEAVVFTARHHQPATWVPQRYGWVEVGKAVPGDQPSGTDSDRWGLPVKRISTKVPLSQTPWNDRIVTGAFYFRSAALALAWIDRLVAEDRTTNGEFYLDDVIGLMAQEGRSVMAFDLDDYLSWGTPEEWKTFEYWARHFHRRATNPFRLGEPVDFSSTDEA